MWLCEWDGDPALRIHLSFSASPPPLGHSLTSLVFGDQSERSSPSDVSLEMEHKDKVSIGGERRVTAVVCEGRRVLIFEGRVSGWPADPPYENMTWALSSPSISFPNTKVEQFTV